MRYANTKSLMETIGTCLKKSALSVLILSFLVGRTRGGELCARTDGSAARDTVTGSIVMAGAAVVGVSSNRSVTFMTDPTPCGADSGGSEQFPDCDDDGLVTLADMNCLYECLTGPDVTAPRDCTMFDLDASGTVDLKDVSRFQRLFGTGIGGI